MDETKGEMGTIKYLKFEKLSRYENTNGFQTAFERYSNAIQTVFK